MAVYTYRAIDAGGRVSTGRMPAMNEHELDARLRSSGLEVIESRPLSSRGGLRRSGVPRKELINFCFHMEQTLRGGVMIPDALADLVDSVAHRAFRDVLTVVLESVRGGAPLSEALAAFPAVFDRVFVGLVRAGEQSGRMPEAFERLAASARWQDELAAQFRKMISYPAFTLAVLLGVTVFMLTYLVPQLAGFIRSTSGDLPLQTRLLLWLSQMLVAHWPLVLAAPVVAAITAVVGLRLAGERTRLRLDRLSLRTPLVGGVIQRIVLARFAALFGMLYASGVPVLKSLEVCEQAAGNRWIAAGIAQVQQAILQGKGLTDAFTQVGLFPNLVLRMVRIGEATGELDKALANVGYFYNREVQETIGRVQALVEPAMTVSLGLLLGWLMVSVLGPVYDLLTRIKV